MKNILTYLKKNSKCIRFVLFSLYCLFIIYYTLLCREKGYEHKADLRLMWAYREMLTGHPKWREDVGYNVKNILFFIPFGLWFPKMNIWISILKDRQWLTVLTIGILFSVFIEITQYITCRGLCELDDMLCNGLGALIGCWLYEVISKSRLLEKFFKGWK